MKKLFFTGFLIAALIFVATMSWIIYRENHPRKRDTPDVEYIDGYHSGVHREGEYIIYEEYIELKNNTDNDLYGYVIADIKRESEFVKEEYAYAYDVGTGDKLLIFIPANSTIEFRNIHLKATSINDEETLRTNREPLADVIFEKVNMN